MISDPKLVENYKLFAIYIQIISIIILDAILYVSLPFENPAFQMQFLE